MNIENKKDEYLAIKQLIGYALKNRTKELFSLIFLILFSSVADIISISAIIPFLGLLTNPDSVTSHPLIVEMFSSYLPIDNNKFLIYSFIIFIALALLAGITRLTLLKKITTISHLIGASLSVNLYTNIVYLPYEEQITKNSSEAIGGLTTKINNTVSVINSIISLIGNIIVFISLCALIIYIDYKIAISSVAILGFGYIVVARRTRTSLVNNSKVISFNTNNLVALLQESLGGIRDMVIDRSQQFFISKYTPIDKELRVAMGDNIYRGGSPRYIMETFGIVVIACISIYLTLTLDDTTQVVPILGAIALAAQRLLPTMQQIFGAWANIMGHKSEMDYIVSILQTELNIDNSISNISFNKRIELRNISYSYKGSDGLEIEILKEINLTINKGSVIGIIGDTGVGKSTLVDIIMGLLVNIEGEILVDGVQIDRTNVSGWRSNIAHVPQEIFLKDDTITSNIAFGSDNDTVIESEVDKAIECAQLSTFIEKRNGGVNYKVGERGANLSGGQKQRIGIARAIYKNADLMVLDEATSALDLKTEEKVISMLGKLEKSMTIIMIAHRMETLRKCDNIYRVSKNGLKEVEMKELFKDLAK
jgi:ATP-binding cassette, subfamily B, bacterial PglK